jgi:hypothetical protein
MEKCKATIRDAVRYCEDGEGDARIPAAAYDSDGELDASAIFCAKCHSSDSSDVRGPSLPWRQ